MSLKLFQNEKGKDIYIYLNNKVSEKIFKVKLK